MNWKKISKISLVALVGFFSIAAVTKDHDKLFEISKNIEIFTNLYQEINTHYVDDLNPSKMMRIGIDAMLEALDPYTNYISESEIEGYRYITEGKYKGIGADFIKIGDEVTVSAPLENSPASKAGLKAGDVLIAVDGKEVAGKRSSDVSRFLKGFPGTEVELTIKRPGTKGEQKMTLTRDEVKVENVPYSGMLNEEVGYLTLTTFTRNAGRNVASAVKKLKENNPKMKGVVFDLRGNGGGLLAEAVNVSNVFVNKGELIVTTKGKVIDWDRSYKTLNRPVDTDIPLVVLVDKGSASASEIVSGVIQDLDRGVYNSKVKITIAKYYIPSGRCIQGVEYADGTPINIPDSLRTPFKTRNGRKVLDGGGVKPDLYLDKTESERILGSLNKKHLIFDYVTQYCLKHETIAEVKDFHFDEFDDFIAYLDQKEFAYDTESEKLLTQLKDKAVAEKYNTLLATDFSTIEQKIKQAKKDDLYEFKGAIVDQIEKEIAARYYFEGGKIQIGLRNDSEVQEAIGLINNPAKYKQLLGK